MKKLNFSVLVFLVVLLTLLLSACGGHIDPAFKPLVDDFTRDAYSHGVLIHTDKLVVEFTDNYDFTNEQGHCSRPADRFFMPTVKINRDYWEHLSTSEIQKASTEAAKKLLIYHELGHCILDLWDSNDSKNIMFGDSDIQLEEHFYLDPEPFLDKFFN